MRLQDRLILLYFVSYSKLAGETKCDFGGAAFRLWVLNLVTLEKSAN
jgi:hypothetical protein